MIANTNTTKTIRTGLGSFGRGGFGQGRATDDASHGYCALGSGLRRQDTHD